MFFTSLLTHYDLDPSTYRFHTIVDLPTYKCVLCLLCVYVMLIAVFTIPFYFISTYSDCNLELFTLFEAFIFVMEAIATTNYLTRDASFNDCPSVVITLVLMTASKLVSDAITIGIMYARIARPNNRGLDLLRL